MTYNEKQLLVIERKELQDKIYRKERKARFLTYARPVAIVLLLLTAFLWWLNIAAGVVSTLFLLAAVAILRPYYKEISRK